MIEDVCCQLHAEEFPYESAAALAAADYDPSQEFDLGVDLIHSPWRPLRASDPTTRTPPKD